MKDDSIDSFYLSYENEGLVRPDREQLRRSAEDDPRQRSLLFQLGRVPISLTNMEYRILTFLSSRPYHAYTPTEIVEAVSTENQPLPDQDLNQHIASLREKLGVFRDYIQTVPYIGYRFKA